MCDIVGWKCLRLKAKIQVGLAWMGKLRFTGVVMSKTKAMDVADWFIARANREKKEEFGEGISNLKLQKILYFTQAASLALDGKEFFEDKIYAWNYGPVVNDVYHQFKNAQATPIALPKDSKYLEFNDATVTFLEDIWQLFGKYSAAKLVEITHSHTPWKNTYDGTPNKVISDDLIKDYYKNVFVRP